MIYKTISNNTKQRSRIFEYFVYWRNAFSECELNNLEIMCNDLEIVRAKTIGAKNQKESENYRKSDVSFIEKNCETSWVFDKFNEIITKINDEYYCFDLNGYEHIQYTVYDSSDNGKYDWHMDTYMGLLDDVTNQMRKLSIVMLLNNPVKDFSGGEFELNINNEQKPLVPEMNKGTIIAFPSFLLHRVKPVYLGVRKSIVIWVEGPRFL